jgi:hypothetical protein
MPRRELHPQLLPWRNPSLIAFARLTHTLADPFAEADEDTGDVKQSQNYIHIRIQRKSIPNVFAISA